MASEVDLCNLALAELGHSRQITAISPPDGTVEASYCARFYPIARDLTLEAYAWGFATRRVGLASLGTPVGTWAYRYAWPNQALHIQMLHQDGSETPEEFADEEDATDGRVIHTNVEDAYVKYTARIVDVNKYPGAFKHALSLLLAAFLAGPILKGAPGRKVRADFQAEFTAWIGQARLNDANGQAEQVKQEPGYKAVRLEAPSVRARRGG